MAQVASNSKASPASNTTYSRETWTDEERTALLNLARREFNAQAGNPRKCRKPVQEFWEMISEEHAKHYCQRTWMASRNVWAHRNKKLPEANIKIQDVHNSDLEDEKPNLAASHPKCPVKPASTHASLLHRGEVKRILEDGGSTESPLRKRRVETSESLIPPNSASLHDKSVNAMNRFSNITLQTEKSTASLNQSLKVQGSSQNSGLPSLGASCPELVLSPVGCTTAQNGESLSLSNLVSF